MKIAFKFLFILQFAEFLALVVIGAIFVNDVDLQRAYGYGIVDHGGGLVSSLHVHVFIFSSPHPHKCLVYMHLC